jgi:hypothetical protein
MDSILLTIKNMLGIEISFDGFDTDIIVNINNAFMTLNQLGIGPTDCYSITGIEELWSDFLESSTNLESIKIYIYLKTRLAFDPPLNSFLVKAIETQVSELEWRLNTQIEFNTTTLV